MYSLAYVERAGGGVVFLCDQVCSQKKSQPNSHNQSQKWALFKLSGCQSPENVKLDFIKKVKSIKNVKVPEIASQILESYQKSQTYQKCQSLRDSKSDFEMLQQPCDV